MTRRSRAARFVERQAPTRVPAAASAGGGGGVAASSAPQPLRLAVFVGFAIVLTGLAVALVVTRLQGPAPTDAAAIQVRASMGGFDPEALTVKPGQTVRIELSSMDNAMHSDGGGWHQFAIDALAVDWKVGPLSTEVFELTAPAAAGTYEWYCDICCGGKENPAMQGKLTVAA